MDHTRLAIGSALTEEVVVDLVVGDHDVEFILEVHHSLDEVEVIGLQVAPEWLSAAAPGRRG